MIKIINRTFFRRTFCIYHKKTLLANKEKDTLKNFLLQKKGTSKMVSVSKCANFIVRHHHLSTDLWLTGPAWGPGSFSISKFKLIVQNFWRKFDLRIVTDIKSERDTDMKRISGIRVLGGILNWENIKTNGTYQNMPCQDFQDMGK